MNRSALLFLGGLAYPVKRASGVGRGVVVDDEGAASIEEQVGIGAIHLMDALEGAGSAWPAELVPSENAAIIPFRRRPRPAASSNWA